MKTIHKITVVSALMLTISSTVMAAGMGSGMKMGSTADSTTSYSMMGTTAMGPGPGSKGNGVGNTDDAIYHAQGWNLVGNGIETPIEVAATYNDKTKVATVWKWVAAGNSAGITYPTWAFYNPNADDSGQAYAASKGYALLTTIDAGEGFWVNAKKVFSVPLPSGEAVLSNCFEPSTGSHALPSGWSLVAIGDYQTPAGFNAQLSATPPTVGTTTEPTNVITVWAWNSTLAKWYMWSPNMVNDDTLTNYISGKNMLGFEAMPNSSGGIMTPSMGFWVNIP